MKMFLECNVQIENTTFSRDSYIFMIYAKKRVGTLFNCFKFRINSTSLCFSYYRSYKV